MKIRTLCAATALCLTSAAHAALFDRGGGMIYDSSQDITWLQDGNYALTSGYPISYDCCGQPDPLPGSMSMDQQVTWADGLTVGGFTDWRLPRAVFASADYLEMFSSPETSELYTLFQQLGSPPIDQTTAGPFFNIQDTYYAVGWFNGEPIYPVIGWWGELGRFDYQTQFYEGAWAVRDGDVMAAIPEPSTWALLLTGLGVVGWSARRRTGRA